MKLRPTLREILLISLTLVMAAAILASSCGRSIFPSASSANSTSGNLAPTGTPLPTSSVGPTAIPTITPTPAMQTFALVTNYNDAKVSVFERDAVSGMLKLINTTNAGKSQGPKGIAVAPNNRGVYVANNADSRIYQYSFDPATGSLDPMTPPWVKSLDNSKPEMVAVDPSGEYLFATNSGNGTIVTYRIDGRTRALTPVSSFALAGDSELFGIALDPTGHHIFVGDGTNGLIYSLSRDRSGNLSQTGNGIASLGSSRGHPGTLVVGDGGKLLYAVDTANGAISLFSIAQGKLTFSHLYPSTSENGAVIGLAVIRAGSDGIAAKPIQSANAIELLSGSGTTAAAQAVTARAKVSAPTGAIADSDGRYLYTADQGDGTVGIFALGSACASGEAICFKRATPAENPPNKTSGPFWIALTH